MRAMVLILVNFYILTRQKYLSRPNSHNHSVLAALFISVMFGHS